MRRELFDFAAAVSLMLCLATVVLWVRSQWTFTRLRYTYPLLAADAIRQQRLSFLWWRDAVEFSVETEVFQPEDAAAGERLRRDLPQAPRVQVYEQEGWSTGEGGADDAAAHHGFFYRSPEASRNGRIPYAVVYTVGGAEYPATSESWRSFFLPWWFLFLAFACPPILTLGRMLRSRARLRSGRCPRCNYDLTGNTSGVCPECGRPVPKQASDKSPRPT